MRAEPVQPPDGALRQQGRVAGDGDAVGVAQVAHEVVVQAVAPEAGMLGQRLGRAVEGGEVVAVALHPVAHLLVDGVGSARRRAVAARRGPLALRAEGAVEGEEALGHQRRRLDRRVRLGEVDGAAAEDRVRRRLPQVVDETQRLAVLERRDRDAEVLGHAVQDRAGQRPLVAFDLAQVAGRQADGAGQRGLADPPLRAQAAQPLAGVELGRRPRSQHPHLPRWSYARPCNFAGLPRGAAGRQPASDAGGRPP